MKDYSKLFWGGVALIVFPVLILTACIVYQLSQMDSPEAGHLNLRWGFVAFYAMAAGLAMLIFARGIKRRELKNLENQRRYEASKERESAGSNNP